MTKFAVRPEFLDNYEIKVVGGEICEEYWIPAEELEEFNLKIVGEIEVISEFKGEI